MNAPAESVPQARSSNAVAYFVALLAWAVPGLGHLVLRKWGRAALFFGAVAALAATGILLRGYVFTKGTGDLFDLLGYAADMGLGGFYCLARAVENGGPDVSRASGDYGTRFLATGGVLNLLCVLDAYQIAAGKKE